MKLTVTIMVILKILEIENRMLPLNYVTIEPNLKVSPLEPRYAPEVEQTKEEEKVIGLTTLDDKEEDYENDFENNSSKACAIVVLSSIQNPVMQSLLRRYRYDSNGILIPSSVQYFIKLPRGLQDSPTLVPLKDKAFSPLGGYVRYYKEVPPIPHTW